MSQYACLMLAKPSSAATQSSILVWEQLVGTGRLGSLPNRLSLIFGESFLLEDLKELVLFASDADTALVAQNFRSQVGRG